MHGYCNYATVCLHAFVVLPCISSHTLQTPSKGGCFCRDDCCSSQAQQVCSFLRYAFPVSVLHQQPCQCMRCASIDGCISPPNPSKHCRACTTQCRYLCMCVAHEAEHCRSMGEVAESDDMLERCIYGMPISLLHSFEE